MSFGHPPCFILDLIFFTSVTLTGSDQFELSIFFPGKENFDSTQVDPLPGKTRNSFAEKKVFFVVNTGAVAANAGDFQQTKAFPVAEGLFVDAEPCRDFFNGQYHFLPFEDVDNEPLSLMTALL